MVSVQCGVDVSTNAGGGVYCTTSSVLVGEIYTHAEYQYAVRRGGGWVVMERQLQQSSCDFHAHFFTCHDEPPQKNVYVFNGAFTLHVVPADKFLLAFFFDIVLWPGCCVVTLQVAREMDGIVETNEVIHVAFVCDRRTK